MRILALSDGRRGIENQCLGLAEAVAREASDECEVLSLHLDPSVAFAALPTFMQLATTSNFGLPPDMDLVIGCGRQAVAPLIALQRTESTAYTVFVQDPRVEPSRFDLVVAPEHDGLSGAFVENTIGSPNRVTKDRIIFGTLEEAERLSRLPMPRAAMLIGGDSKTHTMDAASVASHLATANKLLELGRTLLVTLSRRTPDHAIEAWEDFARGREDVWLHHPDSEAPNPYFAFLGGAEMILVTEDSTNMLTEACATGKPVYRLPMAGLAGKFAALYARLEGRCDVRRYDGLGVEDYEPLDETTRIARIILQRMGKTLRDA